MLLSLLRLNRILASWCLDRLDLLLPLLRLHHIIIYRRLSFNRLQRPALLLLRILSPHRLPLSSLVQHHRLIHDNRTELTGLAVLLRLRAGEIAFKLDLHQPPELILVKLGVERAT